MIFSAANWGFRLGREVIWRHDAKHRLATDPPNPRLGENGRAPVPVFSLVGDYRIFGDVGHHGINSSPQLSGDVNVCVGDCRCRDRSPVPLIGMAAMANIARTTGPRRGAAQPHVARHDFRYSARMSADIFGTAIEGC
jgi:hypothetical protein